MVLHMRHMGEGPYVAYPAMLIQLPNTTALLRSYSQVSAARQMQTVSYHSGPAVQQL